MQIELTKDEKEILLTNMSLYFQKLSEFFICDRFLAEDAIFTHTLRLFCDCLKCKDPEAGKDALLSSCIESYNLTRRQIWEDEADNNFVLCDNKKLVSKKCIIIFMACHIISRKWKISEDTSKNAMAFLEKIHARINEYFVYFEDSLVLWMIAEINPYLDVRSSDSITQSEIRIKINSFIFN